MPGVVISANGILTILSNQFIRPLTMFPAILMGFFFVLAILLATYWLPGLLGALVAGLLTLGGVGAGFLSVLLFNFRAEALSVLILGSVSWLTAVLYKHLLLVAESVRLHRHVITDPISGAVTERYFRLRLETDWLKWKQSRKPLSMVIVQMEPISAQLHQTAWPEVQKKIRALGETFQHFGQAQAQANLLERQVKAAYLYKFAGYIDWPEGAFAQPDSPLQIGIVGNGFEEGGKDGDGCDLGYFLAHARFIIADDDAGARTRKAESDVFAQRACWKNTTVTKTCCAINDNE